MIDSLLIGFVSGFVVQLSFVLLANLPELGLLGGVLTYLVVSNSYRNRQEFKAIINKLGQKVHNIEMMLNNEGVLE